MEIKIKDITAWIGKLVSKRRLNLEAEIESHHEGLNMLPKKPWDIYMAHRDKYHQLQAQYLSRYGHYYKIGEKK